MADYRYYLLPIPSAVRTFLLTPPAQQVGIVDLRNLPDQANTAQPKNAAFVAASATIAIAGAVLLGQGDLREINVTSAMQDAWEATLGYRPQGAKLVDLLFDHLTNGSDPAGATRCKPLIPTIQGNLELHLGGHSLIKGERFDWDHAHQNRVRDVLRADFAGLFAAADRGEMAAEHPRKVLDYWCCKYHVDDWNEFVPQALREHVAGRLPHETAIQETFNTPNSTTLGPNLSWTELNGDLEVSSNACRAVNMASESVARANADLSGTDQWAQCQIGNIGNVDPGVICRKDSTATMTFYLALMAGWPNPDQWTTYKNVAGAYTAIGVTTTDLDAAVGMTLKITANGSSIGRWRDGVLQDTATDSAITTGTRCGLRVYQDANYNLASIMENFRAGDLEQLGKLYINPAYRPAAFKPGNAR